MPLFPIGFTRHGKTPSNLPFACAFNLHLHLSLPMDGRRSRSARPENQLAPGPGSDEVTVIPATPLGVPPSSSLAATGAASMGGTPTGTSTATLGRTPPHPRPPVRMQKEPSPPP